MKSLVTGAEGFVGPHLMAHLNDNGDETFGADLKTAPNLLDAEGWRKLLADYKPEVVYHLAGWSDVGGSWKSPAECWRVNTEGVISVLAGSQAAGVKRVIVVSSADVYGIVTPDALPLTEDSALRPRSPYGASKEAAEVLAGQYQRGWDLDVVVARPFNHIGPGQSENFVASAFAAHIAEAEAEGSGVVPHGDLRPRRDFTDVRDVVKAYRRLAVAGSPGGIYNICSGVDVSMEELLDLMIGFARVPVEPVADPELLRPVELPVLRGSNDRINQDTGWAPEIPLEQTINDVLNDARQRRERQTTP